MNDVLLALEGAWRVLLASLVLGAGLPAVFSLGVRALAMGSEEGDDAPLAPSPLGRVLAALCLLVVLAGVAVGITYIVASGLGMKLTFEHIYPTLVEKH